MVITLLGKRKLVALLFFFFFFLGLCIVCLCLFALLVDVIGRLCSVIVALPGITKAYLYNFDPLKPHVYIVKLGFTGIYIIFVISAQKHRLWVHVRTASARRF